MERILKKPFLISIFIVLCIDIIIGYFFFKSRLFSHLAIWDIIESDKKEDFYWQPENAPKYFHFEPDDNRLSVFKDKIHHFITGENEDITIMLKVAKHIMDINPTSYSAGRVLKWDSPLGILTQIKKGASAHCFYRSILLSTYLTSLGIKSRLWTLENNRFDGISHSINEVYIRDLKKWVFVDTMFGFYVIQDNNPLSLLELRDRLLKGSLDVFSMRNISEKIKPPVDIHSRYRKLLNCVFLRSGNDFADRYARRYGIFFVFRRHLDKLPDSIRRGIDYLFGRRDFFIHYVDKHNSNLKPLFITVKFFFYFFIVSLLYLSIFVLIAIASFLKRILHINIPGQDTSPRQINMSVELSKSRKCKK